MAYYRRTRRQKAQRKIESAARIMINSQGHIVFYAPENKEFKQEFLTLFNSTKRVWNTERKRWELSQDVLPEFLDLAMKYFPDIHGLQDIMETSHDILGVVPTAEREVVEAAYKTLMRKYHPDRVQDPDLKAQYTEKCQEIQEAYREIMESYNA